MNKEFAYLVACMLTFVQMLSLKEEVDLVSAVYQSILHVLRLYIFTQPGHLI